MILAEPGTFSLQDLRKIYPDMSHEVFYLCASRNFCVRFGVYHGENITVSQTLNAGDIYQISYDANWIEVFRLSQDRSIFSIPLPSRADLHTLEPYAYLIFMSESGQTFDVWPVQISGIDHIITNAPFQFCEEYSLIEIREAPEGLDTDTDPVTLPLQKTS